MASIILLGMPGARVCLPILFCLPLVAAEDVFLARVLERARQHISQLPDFVCAQTIERATRDPAQREFRVKDRLHLEVTSIGGQERFAKTGGARFDDRELREMVSRGIVSTGGYALFLRHVTQPGSAEFHPGAMVAYESRLVRRFQFNVPWERSGYTISVPPHQARVAFHGSLLADETTHDVLRLEIAADEIPPELGFDRTQSTMTYRFLAVGGAQFPFATESETLAVTTEGHEYRNRARLADCRKYSADSKVSFAAEKDDPLPAGAALAQPGPAVRRLPPNLLVEVALEQDIAFAGATPDSPFYATLAAPLRDGNATTIAPEGSRVSGRVLELARLLKPVDRYEIVLRLDLVTLPSGETIPLTGRLRDTGGGAGLIGQEKRLMPAFNKKRMNRFSVLVRETSREQAVLYWDARHPRIKKGFRMRWLTEESSE